MSEHTNLFELATRKALRFDSSKGKLTVEDLWNLPLESDRSVSLDSVAIACNRELKNLAEESFVKTRTTRNTEAQMKLDIVKHIIAVRMEENTIARQAVEKKQRKEKIMRILESKQNAQLENLSTEELEKMLEEL